MLSIIGVAYTGADRVRALSVYGILLGLAAVSGQLIGGVLVQADIEGVGLAQLLPDQRADRRGGARARPARRARVARRALARARRRGTVLVAAGLTAALRAGLVFTIVAAAYLVASMKAPALTPRLGPRVLALGALVLATGHGLLATSVAGVGTTGPFGVLAPALLLVGAGMGLVIAPLTATVLGSLEPARAPRRARRR